MSSYKKHILFSIIIALPFFQDVFYLALALIGASVIDMDHHIKKKNLMIMAIFGSILSSILYLFKIPFLIGVSLILLALIFYVSKHRGFMHSLAGIFIISIFLAFFSLGFYLLLESLKIDVNVSLAVISIILGIIILNKKVMPIFCLLAPIGILITPDPNLNYYYIFGAILLGSLSHIILDLFTPTGLELLKPISSKKCKKGCGIILLALWGIFLFISIYFRYLHGFNIRLY